MKKYKVGDLTVANLFCMFGGMEVTIDQAMLIFQLILAQHADKTWGECCQMIDKLANPTDKNIKLCESYVRVLDEYSVVIDNEHGENYLLRVNKYDRKIICFCGIDDYKELDIKEILSIVSFEDKV